MAGAGKWFNSAVYATSALSTLLNILRFATPSRVLAASVRFSNCQPSFSDSLVQVVCIVRLSIAISLSTDRPSLFQACRAKARRLPTLQRLKTVTAQCMRVLPDLKSLPSVHASVRPVVSPLLGFRTTAQRRLQPVSLLRDLLDSAAGPGRGDVLVVQLVGSECTPSLFRPSL